MLQTNRFREIKEKLFSESVMRLIIWCLPTLILLLISVFRIGIVPNPDSLPSFVVIAVTGLIITRIILLLRSRRKAGIQVALLIVWIVIFVVVGFFGLLFMPKTIHHVVKADAKGRFEADIPPYHRELWESFSVPIEIGTADSIEYHTIFRYYVMFESHSWILLCRYNEEEYERAIESMEERFHFRTEPLGTGYYDDDSVEIMDDPYTTIGDELFRMIEPGDGSTSDFYEDCVLIMTNDVKHQIAYIVFHEFDLDMTTSLEELINENCGWKYLRL